MADDRITLDEVRSGIPEKACGHFNLLIGGIPVDYRPVIQSFWKAVEAILPSVRLTLPVHVVLGTSPFLVPAGDGFMTFAIPPDTINMQMECFVFIDVIKVSSYTPNLQVASILEELVHAMMNIPDEVLVKHVTAHLYPSVGTDGRRYWEASDRVHRVSSTGLQET